MQVNNFNIDNILTGAEARQTIYSGVKLVADLVSSTLGPKGRNVTYRGLDRRLVTTKDGVTVAGWVDVKDPILSVGADMIKSASRSALRDAGDGTTTATVLTEALVRHLNDVAEEHSPVQVNQILTKLLDECRDHIQDLSTPVTTKEALRQVATVSANNNPEIGELVADAVWDAGENGKVRIVKTQQLKTTVKVEHGHTWDNGYLSNSCVTNPAKQTFDVSDAYMMCFAGDVEFVSDEFIQSLVGVMTTGRKSLLLVTQNLSEAVTNKLSGINHHLQQQNLPYRLAIVRSAGHGNARVAYMNDFLNLVGKNLYYQQSEEVAIEPKHIVKLDSALVDAHHTTIRIAETENYPIEEAIQTLRQAQQDEIDAFDKAQLGRRADILSGVLVTIQVGGISEEDTGDRNDLIDDAVRACQCARVQGILPGGGNVYRWLAAMYQDTVDHLDEDSVEVAVTEAFAEALMAPYTKIMVNAGIPLTEIGKRCAKLHEYGPNQGYDLRTDSFVDDLLESGIVDPTVVSISSLTAAVAVTRNILMTESIIIPHQYIS